MPIIANQAPAATAVASCQPWCHTRHYTGEPCTSPAITLDFGDRGSAGDACNNARISLTHNAGRTTIGVAFNNDGPRELDDDQATAIAHGLLAMLALKRGDTDTAAMHDEYALEHAHTIDATAPDRPIIAGDRVTWTSKSSGQIHTGTVEAIHTWRVLTPDARVDTDTTGPHKVTTTISVDQLTRIGVTR